MAQFYISSIPPDEHIRRCHESRDRKQRITISGATDSGELKAFVGIVQSVEEFHDAPQGRRWRVTILEN